MAVSIPVLTDTGTGSITASSDRLDEGSESQECKEFHEVLRKNISADSSRALKSLFK